MPFEFAFLDWLQTIHTPFLDKLMTAVTVLGDNGLFWIILGAFLLIFKKTRRCGISVLLALGIGAICGNLILKPVIHRARPCWINEAVQLLIAVPKDYSFPSGHTIASAAAAAALWHSNRKWGIGAAFLAALIAFSRLYLYVHFPTDVLAGALIGIAAGCTGAKITARYASWKTNKRASFKE